jgi:hypothetical protein
VIELLKNEYHVEVLKGLGWTGWLQPKEREKELWTTDKLETILRAVQDLAAAIGGSQRFRDALGGVKIKQRAIKFGGLSRAHHITLNVSGFGEWTVVHELGHAWDGATRWRLSKDMQRAVGAGFAHPLLHFLAPEKKEYWYDPGQGPPPCGLDRRFNRLEDFAEAVTAFVHPAEAARLAAERGWPYTDPDRGYEYADFGATPRGQFIRALVERP